MKKKKFLYFILVVVLVFSCVASVYAQGDNINDLQKKTKQNKKDMDNTKTQIQNIKNRQSDITSEIEKLDKKIDMKNAELEDVKHQLSEINNNIEKTSKELEEAENNIKDKDELFKSRLRVMYENGNAGYLEVLLSSVDIKDFLARKDMVQAIVDHDVSLLKYMKEQRDIIECKKKELKEQQLAAEAVKSEIEDKKQNLVVATRGKSRLVKDLEGDKKELEKQYDAQVNYAKEIESKIRELQAKQNVASGGGGGTHTGGTYTGGKMNWPVPGSNRINSYFGYRIHPIFKTKKLHTGLDIGASSGTPVVAASDGTVIYAGWLGGYGKAVMIDHGGGIVTLYGHNSSIAVSEGQSVKRGQTISYVGSTGFSTGPHLHFEVRRNGAYEDPLPWVRGK